MRKGWAFRKVGNRESRVREDLGIVTLGGKENSRTLGRREAREHLVAASHSAVCREDGDKQEEASDLGVCD